MMILFIISGSFLCFWGIAHLFPTRNVVKGFGEISIDNKRIITMEWIIEGVALIFIGAIVILTNLFDKGSLSTFIVNISSIVVLCILSIISLLTGFKINFLPFKLCPIIFSTSAILILIGLLS